MSELIVLLIFIISVLSVSVQDAAECSGSVPGYYWRDFHGRVPPDALEGGMDVTGKPIYIGQVYATYLIPAKIYSHAKKALYEYGGNEHEVTENVKILCTKNPNQFRWIPTDNDKIKLITDKTLVIGGYEPGCTTYIGRVRTGGEILVGKALADNLPIFAGLHITKNGKGNRHTTFEVLSFTEGESKFQNKNSRKENILFQA